MHIEQRVPKGFLQGHHWDLAPLCTIFLNHEECNWGWRPPIIHSSACITVRPHKDMNYSNIPMQLKHLLHGTFHWTTGGLLIRPQGFHWNHSERQAAVHICDCYAAYDHHEISSNMTLSRSHLDSPDTAIMRPLALLKSTYN